MRVQKFDMHVHTVPSKGCPRPDGGDFATPEELCRIYDQIGVEKGVLLPELQPECSFHMSTNENILNIVRACPGRFAWFCNLHPTMLSNSPTADLSHILLHYRALGARGVGEICANYYFDDPLMLNLFAHCEACNMPVIFHVGNLGRDYGLVDEPGLPRFEKVLGMFPKLRFLGHSQKFWSEISGSCSAEERGGYPSGKVLPGGRIVELMRKYPNCCADLSAGSGYNAITRDPEFGYAFLEEFSDRLYYGTDICSPSNIDDDMIRLSAFLDEAVDNRRISEDAYVRICRTNALAILENN